MRNKEKQKEYDRERRKKYPEKIRAWKIAWNKTHPERVRENRRNWAKANPEKNKALHRAEYHRHKDKYKIYAQVHKDHTNAWRRKKYHENKEATRKKINTYRLKNKDKVREWKRNFRRNNRTGLILSGIKKTCRVYNLEFRLTREWIQEKLNRGVCELTGIAFDMEGKRTQNSPSIDRISSKEGYTPENCRMVLWALNRGLCNYGLDYMMTLFEMILRKNKPEIFTV